MLFKCEYKSFESSIRTDERTQERNIIEHAMTVLITIQLFFSLACLDACILDFCSVIILLSKM